MSVADVVFAAGDLAANEQWVDLDTPPCVTSTADVSLALRMVGQSGGSLGYVDIPDAPIRAGAIKPIDVNTIQVAGLAGIPGDVDGVVIELDTLLPERRAQLFIGACSSFAGSLGIRMDIPLTAPTVLSVPVEDRAICVRAFPRQDDGFTDLGPAVSITALGYLSQSAPAGQLPPTLHYSVSREAPAGFVGVPPHRVLDTRQGGGPIAANGIYDLDLSGAVPAQATAVSMNLTITEPGGPGYVSAYPCETGPPVVSNVNFVAGQTVANAATVAIGPSRHVCFHAYSPSHLVVDLAGWYTEGAGDGYVPIDPHRLFDTRSTGPPLASGSIYIVDLSTEVDGTARAVTMNVTVANAMAPGYVTVYPFGTTPPMASNLNFVAGQTVANLVTVAIPADHRVCFYVFGTTHLLADIGGFYTFSSAVGFHATRPSRERDTRLDGVPFPKNDITFKLDPEVDAAMFNLTITEPRYGGFATAFPCGADRPLASNLNYDGTQPVANLVVVKTAGGCVSLFGYASTHFIVDVAGVFDDIDHPIYTPVLVT